MGPTPPPGDRPRSRGIAALLSFIWPGLGELYVGRRARALVFALPVVVLAALVAWQALGGLEILGLRMLDQSVAAFVLVVVVVLGFWRAGSVVDAWRSAGQGRSSTRPSRGFLVLLLVAVLAMHGLAGWYAYAFYDAGGRIFVGNTPTASPNPGTSGGATDGDAGTTPSPSPSPFAPTSRLTILLTGIDSGHGRVHVLTDTLLVVSVDPVARTAAMISMPRDVSSFRLFSGLTYYDKINSLMTYAGEHPKGYPDGPMGTLTKELGFLLGIPIDYYAVLSLDGFQELVDLVGGVDVDNPKQISDPRYDWFDGTSGFYLSPGPHHLDGRNALAYVRSRQGIGDSDFTRAARQQQVLVDLRQKLTEPAMFMQLPALLDAGARLIRTDFPVNQVPDILTWSRQIPETSIQRFVLGPPYSVHPPNTTTGGTYTLKLDMAKVKALSIKVFGAESAYSK
jgi:cell envelope-related function transcriptional attenuator common domain